MGLPSIGVSVITACFNSRDTIRQAIESVLSQSYSHVEYIIVDGGSTDGTLDIIHEYKDSIDLIISEPDGGIYDALNKGIFAAKGDLVGFLHSDDIYASNRSLSTIVEAAQGQDAVYGDLVYVSSLDTDKVIRRWVSRDFNTVLLSRGWMPAHPTLYVRRSWYEKLGGFDLSYRIAADYESILRLFSQARFRSVYVPETIVKMRMGGVSNGSLRGVWQKTCEDWRALKSNGVPRPLLALLYKNISKVPQFFHRG